MEKKMETTIMGYRCISTEGRRECRDCRGMQESQETELN